MKRTELLSEVIKRIKQNDYSYQIKKYLSSKGITEDNQDEILAEANKIIRDEKLHKLPRQYKIISTVFLALTVLALILFIFVFPRYDIYNYTLLLTILGVIFCITFAVVSFVYFHRLKPENIALEIEDKLESNFSTSFAVSLIPAMIPAIILFFILSYRYAAVEDRILQETQVRTEAEIISGISTQSGSSNSSTIVVRFVGENEKIREVKLDVGKNEFNTYYEGQKVNIVYSSRYPSIVKLLTQEEEIRKFTDTEERDLLPADLEAIITGEFIPTIKGLNKISLGWIEDLSSESWYNENRDTAIRILDEEEVAYVCSYEGSKTFIKALIKNGYKEIKGASKLGGIIIESKKYENEDYVVLLETKLTESNITSVIQMTKK